MGDDIAQGEAEFRIFFPAGVDPQVTSIRVAGDFQHVMGGQDWDFAGGDPLKVEPGDYSAGTFWSARTATALPAGFYQYKYLVEFENGSTRKVTDPCARYSGLSHQNSGIVVGGSRPEDNVVRPLQGGRQPLSELIFYELMIDDFTAEYRGVRAPLDAVTDRLDYLQRIGFNAIQFMPWTAWEDAKPNWGYGPVQYFAVESRYANDLNRPTEKLSWLKSLVSACHDRGIHVIMDGVFNHVSREFPYPQLYQDPATCPFTAASFGGSFPGLQDLDFAQLVTGQLVEDACRYWIDVFGIDGIRFDNTVNYYEPGNVRGLPELLTSVSDHIAAKNENNFSMILEHLDLSAADITNATAATSFWDNSLYQGAFDALWHDRIDSSLLNCLNNRRFLSADKVPTLYPSNHDHSDPHWQAGARENLGAVHRWWKVQPFLIALFTSTAVPLISNGTEIGEDRFLPEDDQGTGRRVLSRPLHWKLAEDRIGTTLIALHQRLATARGDHPALRSPFMYPAEWPTWQTQFNPSGVGVDVGRQLVIYHRWAPVGSGIENIVVALNFSGTDQLLQVPFPFPGHWTDLLASFAGGPEWSTDVNAPTALVPVPGHWGRILRNFNPHPG